MMNRKRNVTHLICCLCVFLITACSGTARTLEASPVELVVDTSLDDVAGGIRLAPPESRWDGYGEAIDVQGDTLVVGAPEWNQLGPGSAYVYRLADGAWQEIVQLIASDRDAGQLAQRFGNAVVIDQEAIAIGAPGNDDPVVGENSGAVYMFEYQNRTWVETAKLTPDHPKTDTEPVALKELDYSRTRPRSFGSLVALSGDTLAVGGDPDGQVYLYQHGESGWQEQARIPIPGMQGRDLYMSFMSLSGDTLALSVFYALPQPEETPTLLGNVVVYVFERSGNRWRESFDFMPDGQKDILFWREVNVGASVSLSGTSGMADLLAVGLPGFPDWRDAKDNVDLFGANPPPFDIPASNRQVGAVYIFERTENGWAPLVTLKPEGWDNPPGAGSFPLEPSPDPGDVPEDSAQTGLLGAIGLPESFIFPGHLFSADPEISFFGATVALDGDKLAVTAGYSNVIYLFERMGQTWEYRSSLKPSPNGELWEDSAQVVALSGNSLLLGTPSEFGNSAYIFDLCALQTLDCE